MTVNDMHIAIDLELNKLNSNLYDIILPQEKDYFLNRAQERLIKQYYSPKSNKKGEGFEMSQKRIDDLRKSFLCLIIMIRFIFFLLMILIIQEN